MIALSIRQPWAWLIVHGHKDVENRTWSTLYRGEFLVHAAKRMTDAEWEDAAWFAQERGVQVPLPYELHFGGVIGQAEIYDCLLTSDSRWHEPAQWGFMLRNARPLPFQPCAGRLKFFALPYAGEGLQS